MAQADVIDAEFTILDTEPIDNQPKHKGVPDDYNWIQWRCKDGRVTTIFDMDDSHLVNATAYYRRTKQDQLLNMCARGTSASKAVLRYTVILQVLEQEVDKRGLRAILDPEDKGPFV